jgi:[protein-PII] uridylyltransferase
MLSMFESLKRQREQLMTDSGEDILSRHTSLLEIAIISLYNRLANRLDTDQFRSRGAVLAIGGFGRGLIGLSQPVPILFLTREKGLWSDGYLDEILAPLRDSGWTLQPVTGTPAELLQRAAGDFEFLVKLIEMRYISGNRQLVDEMDKELEEYAEKHQGDLLERLRLSVAERRARLDLTENWLEPDLEGNPGGIAEITAIRAACRISSNIRSLEDAIFRGYLTRQEVEFLQQADKTYTHIMSLLQTMVGGAAGTLRFDDQEALAARLGYSGRPGYLPVEAFMQNTYQLFHGVSHIAQEFWDRLEEIRLESAFYLGEEARSLEEGVVLRGRRIVVQPDRYPATASSLIHLFVLSARHGATFANMTRQWIQHHRNVLSADGGDSGLKEELLELIRTDGPELFALRCFYDLGLFASILPEVAAVHGLVQHDAFHLYPIHEHHLRTLRVLKDVFSGRYEKEEPELTAVAGRLEDPICLYLAGLLHDIGKGGGKDHAPKGGAMIPEIAGRIGLQPDQSDTVQFLVAQHLLLVDSASLRDLSDEEMLAHCALVVRTPENLDQLLLLSFADMAATGPKALRKYRDTPVLALHEKIYHLLEKGEPSPQAISEKIAQIRSQVESEVADLMDAARLEDHFSQLAPRYLLAMSPGTIARHVRLQGRLQQSQDALVAEFTGGEGSVEITVVSWDTPGLLARTAGILSLHDMNILGAQVFAMNNGMTLLVFQCRMSEGPLGEREWSAMQADMTRLLRGKMALDYRIAAHAASRPPSQAPMRATPSRIFLDNDSSAKYTILEVYTTDRIGLLYSISRTLMDLQIRIFIAKITTKIDQVADVFYIRTHDGEKVTDPEQIEEIKHALCFWLDGPAREC